MSTTTLDNDDSQNYSETNFVSGYVLVSVLDAQDEYNSSSSHAEEEQDFANPNA